MREGTIWRKGIDPNFVESSTLVSRFNAKASDRVTQSESEINYKVINYDRVRGKDVKSAPRDEFLRRGLEPRRPTSSTKFVERGNVNSSTARGRGSTNELRSYRFHRRLLPYPHVKYH